MEFFHYVDGEITPANSLISWSLYRPSTSTIIPLNLLIELTNVLGKEKYLTIKTIKNWKDKRNDPGWDGKDIFSGILGVMFNEKRDKGSSM